MDNKQYISLLLEKYFEGQTTLPEEQILRDYFQTTDVADEHRPYLPLFRYFVEERTQQKEITIPATKPVHSFKRYRLISIGVAACLAVVLGIRFFAPRQGEIGSNTVSQVYINGKPVNDMRLIRNEVLKSLNDMESNNQEIISTQIDILDDFF